MLPCISCIVLAAALSSICEGKSLSTESENESSPKSVNDVEYLESPKYCSDRVLFLFLVHSKVGDFERRKLVRETWGSVKDLPGGDTKLVFVMGEEEEEEDESPVPKAKTMRRIENNEVKLFPVGRGRSIVSQKGSKLTQEILDQDRALKPLEEKLLPSKPANPVQDRLDKEIKEFGDILQGSFLDTAGNQSLKHLMGLRWAGESKCNPVFIVKTRDDVFVETFHLSKFVDAIYANNPGEKTLVCDVAPNSKSAVSPTLDPQTSLKDSGFLVQSSVPKSPRVADEIGMGKMYGDFCSDTAYLMTPDLAAELILKSKEIPPSSESLEAEDSQYVTGQLRSQLGLSPFYLNLRYTRDPQACLRWLRAKNTLPMPYLFASLSQQQHNSSLAPVSGLESWQDLYRRLWKKTVKVHQKGRN